MGCLKLSYYEQERALEVNPIFFTRAVEKNDNTQFFCLSSSRYGFNGQEKDDEVNGVTGSSYTAEFWQYDSRLGRRWNLDPKPTPSISSYSAFAGNPILNSDPKGDTLRVGGDINAAFKDIQSVLPLEYKSKLTLTSDNEIFLDVNVKEVINNQDVGLTAVYSTINSKKNFQYNVDDKQKVIRGGKVETEKVDKVAESSKTYHFILPTGKPMGNKIADPDVDRSRTINPSYVGSSDSRVSLVLHEILEMFIQEQGVPYVTYKNDAKGFDTGAHNKAVDIQSEIPKSDKRRGSHPGGKGGKFKN
ncbi:MAG TPA: hypothetical protein PK649_02450 [Vicingus sp.]|nr:hypothetical protein [Vicingus sp.]